MGDHTAAILNEGMNRSFTTLHQMLQAVVTDILTSALVHTRTGLPLSALAVSTTGAMIDIRPLAMTKVSIRDTDGVNPLRRERPAL